MFARKRAAQSTAQVEARPRTGAGYEALQLLDKNGLEHSVDNFAMATLYVLDRRSMVAMAVDAIAMEGRMLRQSDVDRILAADRRSAKGGAASPDNLAHAALRHRTLELAALAADAASHSSTFGEDLSAGLVNLEGGSGSLEMVVRAMVERTRGVEAELRSASRRIEDLREQVEASREDAQRDALTGLLNRRGAVHELAARRSATGVVAICDVDHFKSVNDRFGHAVGDRVLKGVALSLAESADIHTVARWGGEEFVIIIDGLTTADARTVLERARAELEARTFRLRDTSEPLGTVTISIGAAPLGEAGLEAAIEAADRMLYQAKHAGRNQIAMPLGRR